MNGIAYTATTPPIGNPTQIILYSGNGPITGDHSAVYLHQFESSRSVVIVHSQCCEIRLILFFLLRILGHVYAIRTISRWRTGSNKTSELPDRINQLVHSVLTPIWIIYTFHFDSIIISKRYVVRWRRCQVFFFRLIMDFRYRVLDEIR